MQGESMSETALVREDRPGELTLLQVIAQAARDPQVDVGKMERLVELRRQIAKEEAACAFARDMHAIQAEIPAIVKTAKGHNTQYAKLEDIDRICQPFLRKFGFAVSYTSDSTPQGVIWRCIVTHVQGHAEVFSTPPLPADKSGSKNEVQAIFSSGSYGQRYAFCAAFKIVPRGMDDDGQATSFLTDEQVMQVSDLLNDCKVRPGSPAMTKFLEFAEADSVKTIQQHKFSAVISALRQKAAKGA